MSVIASIEIDSDDFLLGETLVMGGDIEIRIDRMIPLGDTFIPYLWVEGHTRESIENALRTETEISTYAVLDEIDGNVLVRVEWESKLDGILDAIHDSKGSIIEATGSNDAWSLKLRFDEREDLTRFYQASTDNGIPIDVQQIQNPGGIERMDFGLTDTQRKTLVTALEVGYFDVPRRTNLMELAESLGVSDTAVSQRLRRGMAALVRSVLLD